DIEELLGKIVDEMRSRRKAAKISLHIETDAALLGSESELHSIFHNLISNAVRFTPETGSIDVYWRADGVEAVFDVVDTGIGIPAELIPRLTERFYRVDTGRSRATGGTGLGLAIVKHALQRHRGALEIESDEGKGSRFSCRFDPERVVFRRDVGGSVL
ncbi:MAG: ATP-binding protein, partial [Gammaproteobacteria bacterium]|nr:ATP-binding protein [Gammaproteobacteria bacterium]